MHFGVGRFHRTQQAMYIDRLLNQGKSLDWGHGRPALRKGFRSHSFVAAAGHREDIAAGRDVTLSAAVVASWARYAEGADEQGEPINVVDRLANTLQRLAAHQREDPLVFVKNRELLRIWQLSQPSPSVPKHA